MERKTHIAALKAIETAVTALGSAASIEEGMSTEAVGHCIGHLAHAITMICADYPAETTEALMKVAWRHGLSVAADRLQHRSGA
jgi:hypothetical protein